MTVDAQAVIDAFIRALEEPPQRARQRRRPVITISRGVACRGDEIAKALAARLGLDCYDQVIIDQVAARAGVSKQLIDDLTNKLDAVDSWIYSAVFGGSFSRDQYVRYLTTIVRGLYHTGGVICGRGAHVVLAGRDILRVRLVGSIEVCASRLSEEEGLSYSAAKKQVHDRNRQRERFVQDVFHSRLDDPATFDLVVNTDNFRHVEDVVELLVAAVRARGLDRGVVAGKEAAVAAAP